MAWATQPEYMVIQNISVQGQKKGAVNMSDNLAYQEERREELIGGKVVMMSPASTNHTFVSGNIHGIFWHYLKGKNVLLFLAAPRYI